MQALFACSRCFSRHPFEDLSPGQQLCKVSIFVRFSCVCYLCISRIFRVIVICDDARFMMSESMPYRTRLERQVTSPLEIEIEISLFEADKIDLEKVM